MEQAKSLDNLADENSLRNTVNEWCWRTILGHDCLAVLVITLRVIPALTPHAPTPWQQAALGHNVR